ncbi:MAG: DNA ligase D [Proteobacteria bacterium]|nr:DNA ligase D [Pseudomonadota bacterium]
MPNLKTYRDKRDPAGTPEPFGDETPVRRIPAGAAAGFVVQQHAASQLHWDLRLEIDGVLASWAVPKGPSTDPEVRRLAVRTEDHPLEYADFEGVIPDGNYGAGAMIVWDAGVYHTVDGRSPAAGLEAGKLDLLLQGHKLRGRFALVRTARDGERQWLLISKEPADAESELVEREPYSVLSGLTVRECAAAESREGAVAAVLDGARAPRRELTETDVAPMLARTTDEPFSRPGWLFELKFDGVRVRAEKRADGPVALFSRGGRPVNAIYPELARAVAALPLDAFWLDGEIVALDERGRSRFERLQRRFTQTDPGAIELARREVPVVLMAFDLLSASGRDLRGLPLAQRKAALAAFCPRNGFVRFADHVDGDGRALYTAAREHGLEGVVAKDGASAYQAGRRSPQWLKIKVPQTGRLAVMGVLPGKGSRRELGSLMLAWQRDGRWYYAGNVGSGLTDAEVAGLPEELAPDRRDEPVCPLPLAMPRGTWFVAPRHVCEVRYTERTEAGLLRNPVWLGRRPELELDACVAPDEPDRVAEEAAAAPAPGPKLSLSRLDKVFWPEEGFTKQDLLGYYRAIWPWIEVYLRDRPLVLTRYPDGIEGKHFFQKNAPGFTPDWVTHRNIDGTDYFVCNELDTLLYVVNSGAIPLHVWSARVDALERPDWLLLDLDPKDASFADVVDVARAAHKLLDSLGARSFVKTSGQTGLHVLVPLGQRLDHAQARALADALARTLAQERPDQATVRRPLAARGGRVYVDAGQNGLGKLMASPLCVRPRPGAPVSMPLRWTQVTKRLDPGRFTLRSAPRLLRSRPDPLAEVLGEGVDVDRLLDRLAEHVG